MTNPCSAYYKNQAGNGLPAFEGLQYQRGGGFFGNAAKYVFANILKPIGNYLFPKAVKAGTEIGSDILKGENFGESVKKNLKRTGQEILEDGFERAGKFIQTGKGRRRRRRKGTKRACKKSRSPVKKRTSKRTNKKRKLKPRKKRRKSNKANIFKNLFK